MQTHKFRKPRGRPKGSSIGEEHRNQILDPRIQSFIKSYVKSGNATKAAKDAGFHASSGKNALKMPQVREAILKAKEKVMNEIEYGLKQAMQEAEDAIIFAMKTDNANAYVKAVELRSKLNGLLVDKLDVRSLTAFSINIVGIRSPSISIPPPSQLGEKIVEGFGERGILIPGEISEEEEIDDEAGKSFEAADDPFSSSSSEAAETEEDPFS